MSSQSENQRHLFDGHPDNSSVSLSARGARELAHHHHDDDDEITLRLEGARAACEEQDILSRAHTATAHERHAIAERYISGWLHHWDAEDYDSLLYQHTPHANGFEQNVCGMTDAYLARVEENWRSTTIIRPLPANDASHQT